MHVYTRKGMEKGRENVVEGKTWESVERRENKREGEWRGERERESERRAGTEREREKEGNGSWLRMRAFFVRQHF